MLADTLPFVLAHGATGTWLDEFIEIGIPLIVFVGLYLWSNRKEKATRRAAGRDEPVDEPPHEPLEERAKAAGEKGA